MIELDLRRDLSKVTAETVAAPGKCYYTSPCAVGAMMTVEQRAWLAKQERDGASVKGLVSSGLLTIPPEQLSDFERLQATFDRSANTPDTFFIVLRQMKEKYDGSLPR